MIGKFEAGGNLVPGVHDASWEEFTDRFGRTTYRLALMEGLERALRILRQVGCKTVYIDGSFVTDKEGIFNEQPGDFDVCWDEDGVDIEALNALQPAFLDFTSKRAGQRKLFGGEFFPSRIPANHKSVFLDYFQVDKHTGRPKGIVRVNLDTLP